MALNRSEAFQYLRHAHEHGRLAHAYLISGAPGSGKRRLASDLSNFVTGSDVSDVFAGAPPGVYLAEPESKSRRIVIEQVRTLEHALQMRSSNGRRKVAIVLEADRLVPQAANAFLKTLEEPPNDSLLLLLSSLPEVLPDTILSRCISVPLAPEEVPASSAEEKELVELLATAGNPAVSGVQRAYRLARGFNRLLAQIRETIGTQNEAALKRDEMRYKNTTDGSWLDERETYYKALTESQYARQRSRLIETLLFWWTDALRSKTGIKRRELPSAASQTRTLAEKLSTSEILRRIKRIEEMRDHLERNVQEALVVEVAFLSVFTF
jgi:DNA polymerase-3 subunit delta'